MSWEDGIISKVFQSGGFAALKTESSLAFDAMKMRLSCIWDESSKTRAVLEAVYGRAPGMKMVRDDYGNIVQEYDDQFTPRSMATAPLYIEDEDTDGAVATVIHDILAARGRFAPGGYIANIGGDEFRAVITAADGNTTRPITVPADSTEVFDFFVKAVTIIPTNGTKARYRIKAN